MKTLPIRALSMFSIAAVVAQSSFGQIVLNDDFDSNSTANWVVNLGGGNNAANLFFDYSTIGIPSAPNSVGGSTYGAKLSANLGPTTGFSGGVSISPLGGSFLGDYILTFDMWINFNGPFPGGGNGSTQMTGAGIGTTGTQSINHGTPNGAVWFAATGDGGNGDTPGDYRAYVNGAVLAANSGAYYAGTAANSRNDLNSYYAGLGGVSAPAAQVALYPQQSGTINTGAAGMQWHEVTLTKTNGFLNWNISGRDIALVDLTGLTLSTNIALIHSDINTGISSDANREALAFGLIDNVVVTIVPEPTTATLAGLGLVALVGAIRRRRTR
jgi:hypothetical protein